jgi:predicted outer membrane protein
MRRRGAIAMLALVPALWALPGCGGSSGSKSSSTSTTGTGSLGPPHPSNSKTPAPRNGKAAYLSLESQRAAFESFLAGIASGRASAQVKTYAQRVLRERSGVARDDRQAAKKLKVRIPATGITAVQQRMLRSIIPLTGRRFDSAYLKLELKSLPQDISSAVTASKSAPSADVRKLASKHLTVFRSELSAAQSARP